MKNQYLFIRIIPLLLLLGILFFTGISSSTLAQSPATTQSDNAVMRDTVPIQPRETWRAQPAKPFKKHSPTQITIHHEGGKVLRPDDDAKTRLKNIQSWCMGPDRNWADIPYHLLIAPDGTVYQGRNPLTVGESNTEYDPTGHLLICFLGNYQEQTLDDTLVQTLINLLVDSCIKYNIDPRRIATHRDHSDQTTCPGENIYSYFQNSQLLHQVNQQLESHQVAR